MTTFGVDPLNIFDQQQGGPAERQGEERVDKRTRNLRLRIVVQPLARARFSNNEQGFKRPAIACLDVQSRERLVKRAVRQAICSDQVADQGLAFGAAQPQAPVQVLDGGILYGMLSMDSYVFGGPTTGAAA